MKYKIYLKNYEADLYEAKVQIIDENNNENNYEIADFHRFCLGEFYCLFKSAENIHSFELEVENFNPKFLRVLFCYTDDYSCDETFVYLLYISNEELAKTYNKFGKNKNEKDINLDKTNEEDFLKLYDKIIDFIYNSYENDSFYKLFSPYILKDLGGSRSF